MLTKERGGFVLVASNMTGTITRLHTYDDYSNLLSTNRIFEYSYILKTIGNGSQKTYCVLNKRPKEIGTLDSTASPVWLINYLYDWYRKNGLFPLLNEVRQSTDHMVNAAKQYLTRPERYHKYDEKEVWGRVDAVKSDVESMYIKYAPGTGTEFIPTYNKKYDSQHWDTQISDKNDKIFTETVESITRNYRTKAQYLTLSGKLEESQLSRLTGREIGKISTNLEKIEENKEDTPSNLNSFKNTGTVAYVDSVFAQVCLRERHIAEFFVYFAIVSYMKRSRRYPNSKAAHVLKFLRSFLKNSHLKWAARGILIRLSRIGMISIEGDPKKSSEIRLGACISLLKQSSYVRQCEKAWNSKNSRSRRTKRLWRTDIGGIIIDPLYHTDQDMNPLDPAVSATINSIHRPYFDMHFPKTCKMDTGFINLIHGSRTDQRAFLYELVVSSWDYPVSRTRIATNLLITPSTQRQYERKNQSMAKRFNHTELPTDLIDRLTLPARNKIMESIRIGGKFKQSRSGKIYRQEGNTYISNRIKWKLSKECSRLRLSHKHIKLWRMSQPVFTKSKTMSGNTAVSAARFMPINKEVCNRQPLSKTYISKKAEISKGRYFALRKNGVALLSTDPQNWDGFEPLMEYDRKNGDMFVPLVPSLPQKSRQQQWARVPQVFGAREAGGLKGDHNIGKRLKTKSYASVIGSSVNSSAY